MGKLFGFTLDEVQQLCERADKADWDELKLWYDGCCMENTGYIYNPRSVVEALEEGVQRLLELHRRIFRAGRVHYHGF